ncbi:MAG: helix-turn-helix domain-containing protein [Desulfovibrio sp.]|jgi:excisionase family DNA binding protein|nr:helix-turn-helix domain-containing protein [Desulfovibrio sp.]
MDESIIQYSLLTLQEVAGILRVNRSSVSRLLKARELAYIAVGGRKLVDSDDLRMFLDNRKVKTDGSACRDGE